MPFYEVHTARICGDVLNWNLTINKFDTSDPGSTPLDMERTMMLTYGEPLTWQTGESALLFSFLDLTVFDDEEGSFKSLVDSLNSDQDCTITIEDDDSNFTWSGYMSRVSLIGPRYPDLAGGRYRVRFYDGISLLSEEPNTTADTDLSIHQLTNRALYDRCQELDVNYILSWLPSNQRIYTTGPGSGVPVNDTKFRFATTDLNDYDTFVNMLEDFDARAFLNFRNGKWHVQQRLTDGQQVTAASGAYMQSNSGATATDPGTAYAEDTIELTDFDIYSTAGAPSRPRVRSEIIRQLSGGNAIELMRDGGFEVWEDFETPIYGRTTGSVFQDNAVVYAGFYSLQIEDAASQANRYEQDLAWVTEDANIRFSLTFRGRHETNATNGITFRFKITPYKDSDDTYYSDSGGTWSTTDDWVLSGNVSDSTFTEITHQTTENPPVTGLLSIEWGSQNVAGDAYIDAASILALDSDDENVTVVKGTFERVADAGGVASGEEMVRDRYTFEQGQGLITSYIVTNDGNDASADVAGWLDENGSFFPFLSAEGAQARLERTGVYPNIIVGRITGELVSPGRAFSLNGTNYRVAHGCTLDLVRHETEGTFIEKYRELP